MLGRRFAQNKLKSIYIPKKFEGREKMESNIISIIALLVSVGIFIIQLNTHLNRNFEKANELRTNYLNRLLNIKQRMKECLVNTNLIRILLRNVNDSEDKFNSIEMMPSVITEIEATIKELDNLVERIEKIVIQRNKIRKIINILQENESIIKKIELKLEDQEKKTIKILDGLRK